MDAGARVRDIKGRPPTDLERVLGHLVKGPCTDGLDGIFQSALLAGKDARIKITSEVQVLTMGAWMEQTKAMLEAANAEVEESRKVLDDLVERVRDLRKELDPELAGAIVQLREQRMAVVREVRDSLTALRDLRAFFLEDAYELEVTRLERFVRLCREIQALKAEGVFDAVVDSALRLAVRE